MKKKLIKILLDKRRKSSAPTQPANDIYPSGDAASKWEAALNIGLWSDRSGAVTVTAETVESRPALQIESTGAVSRAEYNIANTVIGRTYQMKFEGQTVTGSSGTMRAQGWTNVTGGPTETIIIGWNSYDFTMVATGTNILMRFYVSVTDNAGDKGQLRDFEILDLGVV